MVNFLPLFRIPTPDSRIQQIPSQFHDYTDTLILERIYDRWVSQQIPLSWFGQDHFLCYARMAVMENNNIMVVTTYYLFRTRSRSRRLQRTAEVIIMKSYALAHVSCLGA